MVVVGIDPVEVERQLRVGALGCPCGGGLGPWGHARERAVRGVGSVRPRRGRCGSCGATHVLLSVSCLLRRADGVETIGTALLDRQAATYDLRLLDAAGLLRIVGRGGGAHYVAGDKLTAALGAVRQSRPT